MLGGYQIIDLRNIGLEITSEPVTITDTNVLKQLLNLRDHINSDYDFTKPLEKQLKPVLLRYRDATSDEELEGSSFGEVSIVDNYYSFKISSIVKSKYQLILSIIFTLTILDDGNEVWDIDTATIHLKDPLNEDISINGNLIVSGNITGGTYEDIDLSSITIGVPTGITSQLGYCKLRKTLSKELYIVLNWSLTNTTEDTIYLTNAVGINAYFPEDISKEIIDVNGDSLHEDVLTDTMITGGSLFHNAGSNAGFIETMVMSILHGGVDRMKLQPRGASSIGAGQTFVYTFRITLTI